MKNIVKILSLTILLTFSLAYHSLKAQTGAQNPNSTTSTLFANESVIASIKKAVKSAGKDPKRIPVEIVKRLALTKISKEIGGYMNNFHICDIFDHWASQHKVGATGTITLKFIIVAPGEAPGPDSPVVIVEYFVKKNGQNTPTAGRSGATGYAAPIIPGKGATMSYDLFGDGEYILTRLDCPSK